MLDRPKVKRDGRGGRALVLAREGLDGGAELRLVERTRGRVLGVDRNVALLRRAKLVDEVVLAEVKIGDVDEEGPELGQQFCERGRERGRLGRQVIDRMKCNFAIGGNGVDLGEVHPIGPAARFGGEILHRRRVFGKRRLQPRDRHDQVRSRERQTVL